jgi:hypothetical protein
LKNDAWNEIARLERESLGGYGKSKHDFIPNRALFRLDITEGGMIVADVHFNDQQTRFVRNQ